MPRRLTNLVLLAAVTVLLVTGVVPWLASEAAAAPLYVAHRVAGVALVLALVWKYGIARRSLVRRVRSARIDAAMLVGVADAAALVVSAGLGLAWTAGLVSFDRPWSYSALNIHVFAGIALGALVLLHALQRGERRPSLGVLVSRRAALRLVGLGAAALVVTAALDRVALARRLTGSRHAGSFSGNAFPLTTWAFDEIPAVDAATWRLSIDGKVARPGVLALEGLAALPRREISAVLDCTGGWWSEQTWLGVALDDLLAQRGADERASVEVISVTGHSWIFDRSATKGALLATHVGGESLSFGHGYPLRLVVPERRGFAWIKWVGAIHVI